MHAEPEYQPDPDWRLIAAAKVVAVIKSANRGTRPDSPDQWSMVVRRLGFRVRYEPLQLSFAFAALEHDKVIITAIQQEEICRQYAHELTELIARRETGETPLCVPCSSDEAIHLVALMVERWAVTGAF